LVSASKKEEHGAESLGFLDSKGFEPANVTCSSLPIEVYWVIFQVLTAASMKTVFWDVAPCRLVEID
jgi:hypothetical protein